MFQKVTQEAKCPEYANKKILQRDAIIELRRTAKKQTSFHFQRIQYLEK